MEQTPAAALLEHFAGLPAPRLERRRRHKLSDILVIAVCAVLGGAESCPAIEDCGGARAAGRKHCLALPEGIPAQDPFTRVLRLLEPVPFQACLLSWRQAVAAATQGEGGAIDGKRLRRSFEKGPAQRAIHLGSAGATEKGGVLGQRKVDAQANEVPALAELLALLALQGGSVTLEALGGQRPSAQPMVEPHAD